MNGRGKMNPDIINQGEMDVNETAPDAVPEAAPETAPETAPEAMSADRLGQLAGWEGPASLAEGVYRYSKYFSLMRIYIDVEFECRDEGMDYDFYGGSMGRARDFEVRRENGQWMLFNTAIAWTPRGEPVVRLRGCSTWDLVYERISTGTPLDEEIEALEDLAVYIERYIKSIL